MSKKPLFIPNRLKPWIDARQRFRLSHAHVQMAFELGLNPKKFGKLANHRQEPWKLPLPDFIAKLYVKNFGKAMPDPVRTIEQMAAAQAAKRQAKKLRKATARSNASEHGSTPAADKVGEEADNGAIGPTRESSVFEPESANASRSSARTRWH
jgi:hypothetical protein